jgi:hypothetical protein
MRLKSFDLASCFLNFYNFYYLITIYYKIDIIKLLGEFFLYDLYYI